VGPLRILILAALLYIGYRLISANFKKDSGEQKEDNSEEPAASAEDSGPITDVLIEDPVCRKLVPKQQAHTIELNGESHHFCSKECAEIYAAEHDKSE